MIGGVTKASQNTAVDTVDGRVGIIQIGQKSENNNDDKVGVSATSHGTTTEGLGEVGLQNCSIFATAIEEPEIGVLMFGFRTQFVGEDAGMYMR